MSEKPLPELYAELYALEEKAAALVQTWKKKRAKIVEKINALKAQIKEQQN